MTQYNPKNIEETLKRMEKADELKGIHRSGTNIMSFFDDNDKEYELQKQQSAAELKPPLPCWKNTLYTSH